MKTLFALVSSFILLFSVLAQPQQGGIPHEVKALADELKENLNVAELFRDSKEIIVEIERFKIKSRRYTTGRRYYHGLNPQMIPQLSDDEIVDFVVALNNAALVCYSFIMSALRFDEFASYEDAESTFPSACFSLGKYFGDDVRIETKEELSDFMALVQAHSQELSTMSLLLTTFRYYETDAYRYNTEFFYSGNREIEELVSYNYPGSITELAQNISGLKNADIYSFYMSAFMVYVAFEQGKARVFMIDGY